MTQRAMICFELKDLQFDWQANRRIGPALIWLISKVNTGFIYGLWGGLFLLIILWITKGTFAEKDILNTGLLVSLCILGLLTIFGLLGFLYLIFWKKEIDESPKIITKERWAFSKAVLWQSLRSSLPSFALFLILIPFLSIQAVLVSALLYTLYAVIIDLSQKGYHPFLQINYPYQRFWASLRSLDFAIVQHFSLRVLLWRSGALPFRLRHFLDDMVRCHILESDGASWRFRHDFLQRYFYEAKNIVAGKGIDVERE